jgi:hypothetical protein
MNQCNRFRNDNVLYFVFHQDKVDASFCGHMIHPPLLASNCFFFLPLKTGISIQLVAIATIFFTTQNTSILRVFFAVQLKYHTGKFA